ncbi:MAG: hypothetical protein AB7L65_08725 [Hyphomonadaceae bacterium]
MVSNDPPFLPPAAWALVQDGVRWLIALFGAPEEMRARRTHAKRDHALLLSWLRSLEALAARLLLVKARAIVLEKAPPRAPRMQAAPARRASNSNAWRVAFRVRGLARRGAKSQARVRMRCAETAPGPPSCLGAAARFEALRRVADDPLSYAKRLARALARDPQASLRIACAPYRAADPFAPAIAAVEAFLFEEAALLEEGAARAHADSS